MIYTAEILKVGDFQAPTKKILTEKIVNYFRENEDETCKIVSIRCDFKDDTSHDLCQNAIDKSQEILDKEIEEARKSTREERLGREQIESDFYDNLI